MIQKLKKILKNPYSLSLTTKIFSVLVGFLFTVFQARFLGPEIKGQVATVNSIVSVSSIIFAFGISQAYPYYKKNSKEDLVPVFMKIALIMLLVYISLSFVIIMSFTMQLKYIAVFLFTPLMVYDGLVSYITLVEEPNKRSLTDMAVMIGELALVVLFWMFVKPSLLAGLLVITAKDITKAVLFTWWWRKRIFVPSDSVWHWIPKLLKFGFFPMMSLLMATLNYRVDVMMLNGRVPDAAIGIYSVGSLMAERVWLIPDALKGVLVSRLAKGKDAREVSFVIRMSNTGCMILILGIALLGKPFITFVFGPEYQGAYQITMILLIGVFSMIYYKGIVSYFTTMGKQNLSFIFLSVGVICNIFANLILIPLGGIYGAGLASVMSYTLSSALFIVFFYKMTGITLKEMLFLKKSDISSIKKVLK